MDLGPLNKKIGPLPLWGYLAGGAGAVVLFAMKKKGSQVVQVPPGAADSGASAVGGGTGDSGGYGTGAYGGSYFNPGGAGQNYYTCQDGTIVSDLSLCPSAPIMPTVPISTGNPPAVASSGQPCKPTDPCFYNTGPAAGVTDPIARAQLAAYNATPGSPTYFPNETQANLYNQATAGQPGALQYLPGSNGVLFTQQSATGGQLLYQIGDPRAAALQASLSQSVSSALAGGQLAPGAGFSASFQGGSPTLHFAQGGVSPGGIAEVGENGPELLYLPPGVVVQPLPDELGMGVNQHRQYGHFDMYDLNVAVIK